MPRFLSRRGLLMGSAALAGGTLLLGPGAPAARAERARRYHALLVAVTDYPGLPPRNALTGPNNDVRLARHFLLEARADAGDAAAPLFAEADIAVLADGLEFADAAPSLQAIRAAMAGLAERAGKGDFVYLHFGGHGHQQPARFPEQEIDGLDQVFMPRDVGILRQGMDAWPNAYVDKDIKDDIDAIRRKGAFVWAVFDCCHSATMTRNVLAADSEERERRIDVTPEEGYAGMGELEGVTRGTEGTPRQAMLTGQVAEPLGAGAGGFVAFYASQTVETTPEMPLPRGAEDRTVMGLFSFTLMSRLAENPSVSYRQLGDAVMQSYVAMNRTRPVPMFEGDLDARVFALGAQEHVPQWRVQMADGRAEIPAGAVHRLGAGTRLAVLPSAVAGLDEALGVVAIASAGTTRSILGPVVLDAEDMPPELPMLEVADIPANAVVRVIDQMVPMELTVALPPAGTLRGTFDAEAARVTALLEDLAADGEAPLRLRLVPAGDPADVRFDVLSRAGVLGLMEAQEGLFGLPETIRATAAGDPSPRLWLMDASASLSLRPGFEPPSVGLSNDEAEAEWLRDSLIRVFRANTLARLAAGTDFGPDEVKVEVFLADTVEPIDVAISPTSSQALSTSSVQFARADQIVHVRVTNNSMREIDVHTLFIGTDYSIVPSNFPERLRPGLTYNRPSFVIDDSTKGRERVVVVLAEAEDMAPTLNLSFLGQEGVRSRNVSANRGLGTGLRDLLSDIAEAPATRAAKALGGSAPQAGRGAVLVFPLEVQGGEA